MGACASKNKSPDWSESQITTYNSMSKSHGLPRATPGGHGFGYRPPQGTKTGGKPARNPRNSNEQTEEDRGPLIDITDNASKKSSRGKPAPSGASRFGFRGTDNRLRKPDPNSNVMGSLDSLASTKSKTSSTGSLVKKSIARPKSACYDPKYLGSEFKMIDDDSSSAGRQSLLISTDTTTMGGAQKDDNGNAIEEEETNATEKVSEKKTKTSVQKNKQNKNLVMSQKTGIVKSTQISQKSAKSKGKGFLPKLDKWTKAENAGEDDFKEVKEKQTKSQSVKKTEQKPQKETVKSGQKDKPQSKLKFWGKKSSSESMDLNKSSHKRPPLSKSMAFEQADSGIDTLEVERNDIPADGDTGLAVECTEEGEVNVEVLKEDNSLEERSGSGSSSNNTIVGSKTVQYFPPPGCDVESHFRTPDEIKKEKKPKQVIPPVYPSGAAPMASVDSLDVTSMGSIDSDDLMLECDINFDDDEVLQHSTHSFEHTNSLGRPRTKSGDSLDSQGSMGWRHNALRRQDSGARVARSNSLRKMRRSVEAEPLKELSSLVQEENPLLRRHPRVSKSCRPASFPGPSLTQETLPVNPNETADPKAQPEMAQIKLRRQTPSVADDEQVFMDGFTHRHVMQDITAFKTLLFKLKRTIQEEEIGSPFGKNGYSFTSQPNSPMVKDDVFGFDHPLAGSGHSDDLSQENADLRQQLAAMQKQLEEKDRTIKLLQQQMTKYECGPAGDGSRPITNVSTQTDKPRFAMSKSVLRAPSDAKAPNNENVISSNQSKTDTVQNKPQTNGVAHTDEKHKNHIETQQRQLPRYNKGGYQSKLPSYGMKKNTKKTHQKSNGVA